MIDLLYVIQPINLIFWLIMVLTFSVPWWKSEKASDELEERKESIVKNLVSK